MKSIVFLLLMSSLSLSLQAQFNPEKDPYLVQALNKSINQVNAKTSGGSIAITGIEGAEARLEVYVQSSGRTSRLSKAEIKEKLHSDYEFNISVDNQVLNVTARPKNKLNWKQHLSISYKIFVPKKVSSNLNTSGGSIKLLNLTGSQQFSTSGGSLQLSQLHGEIDGRTSGGSIRAENSSGNISLATSGGSLNLIGLKGTIKANTSGGSINGSDITGELITGTSGGSVNLDNLSCSLKASTSGGSMNVALKQLGKYVNVSSAGGNVKVEVPAGKGINLNVDGNRLQVGPLKNFSGESSERSINGTLNGGGIPVKVQGSGSVAVAFL